MLHTITLVNLGVETQLPEQSSLTDLVEMVDSAIPFSCLSGICGSCVIEVTNGHQNLSEEEFDERAFLETLGYEDKKYRLACQCKLKGPVTINTAP